jgi:site-specific recombinase XerD
MPLPVDVGRAVAEYLRRSRPSSEDRTVFLRTLAPRRGLTPAGVTWAIYNACDRAGLPKVGAHCLRRTAATLMLRGGASLTEVGQALRHRRIRTTGLYAKVDHARLASLVRPWPGATP